MNTKDGSTYLVPYDGDPMYPETKGYALSDLYASLGRLPDANATVALDSCFSGAGGRSVIAKGARPMLITVEDPLMATQNLVVLSAAAGDQISYYVTGTKKKVTAYENARLVTEWDASTRDENVEYYVGKLDELAKKFDAFAPSENEPLLF